MRKTVCGVTLTIMMVVCSAAAASAQVSIAIGAPNVSIGINLPFFPELTPVPGYPVYYAPQVDGNYFFYDGMYWVYQDDSWYASSWYNGPWAFVQPEAVPLFVLRIPVRYYRQPPVYFHGWQANAPPRWGQHWGYGWEQRRRGWDHWNRKTVPARAPQPVYQRQYAGEKYPGIEQQHSLRSRSYRYQPRDRAVRQHLQQQGGQKNAIPAERVRKEAAPGKRPEPQKTQQAKPLQHGAPADQFSHPPQRGGEYAQKQGVGQPPSQQHKQPLKDHRQQPEAAPREKQDPVLRDLERKTPDSKNQQESGQGRDHKQNNDGERGRERNN